MKLETLPPTGEVLDLVRSAPFADVSELAGTGDIVVLAPHPDDESLGCGAAIARACDHGRHVHVFVMTDGSVSHPNSRKYPPDRLAEKRKAEVQEAVRILAPGRSTLTWLGIPDTQLPSSGSRFEEIVETVSASVTAPNVTSLWSSWGGDPHCDHEATAAIARAVKASCPAVRHWSYPVWGRFAALGGHRHPYLKTVRRLAPLADDRKHRAIAAHASQMTHLIDDDPEGFVMPQAMQTHFADEPEIFFDEDI